MILLLLSQAHAVTREAALDHAAAYAIHEWTMTSVNETADCTDDYESDYTAGTWWGLPYDWGGYVTLDEFDEQIAEGLGAGSHSWHGILSCTTGVDCSGYVSEVWETGHYSTSTFSSVTTDISASSLKRADAVNDAGSHVVLYTYETDAGVPVFYEASGGAEKVRVNGSSGWSYLDGYQPIRFDDIEDGTSTGTSGDPIEITSFPYEDTRWTAGSASDVLDTYSCASGTDESGPEMLYHFTTTTGGLLTAVVSDDDGVDIDVHVLTAVDEDACLGRDDTEVSVEVPAGDVWISLDTYVSSREYPGPYILTVNFDGDASSGTDGGTDGGSDGGSDGGADGGADDGGGTDGGQETGQPDTAGPADPVDPPGIKRGFSAEGGGLCATGAVPSGAGLALALAAAGLRRRRRA